MAEKFKTIALIGKYQSPDIAAPLGTLARFLTERGIQVLLARQTAERVGTLGLPSENLPELAARADLAIVMGGDGTMLNIARTLVEHDVPLLGINQGRLGFLTDVSIDTMDETIGRVLAGDYITEERILLRSSVWRAGEKVFDGCSFNDVVVGKGTIGRLIEVIIYIDGDFVYSQRLDGIVVATPTGSTAYALSAGGPILHPSVEAVALVPICPHTLSARPIVLNSHASIEVLVTHADDARVHFDGQRHFDLIQGDRVRVGRAERTIRLLHPVDHSYYALLRQKLHWGEKL